MEKGDLILIPFPFTNLSGQKNRPALVLITHDKDVTVAFITSKIKWPEEFDFFIKADEVNGLKTDSLLRIGKITTIEKDLVIGKIGILSTSDLKKVNSLLIRILKLKP